jgi:hypothetical protein
MNTCDAAHRRCTGLLLPRRRRAQEFTFQLANTTCHSMFITIAIDHITFGLYEKLIFFNELFTV